MRSIAAMTFLVTRALAEGVRISAIALVVSVALGTSERLAVVIVIALTIFYTFEGGMKAVIWTDVAQFLLYLSGSLVTLFLLLHRIPGGWNEVTQVAAAAGNKLQFLDFSWNLATKYTFWSGVIGGAFLTMATHGTDQTIVQRLLAARNEKDSRKALLSSGFIVLFQFTVFLLVGVLLYVFAQHTPLLAPGESTDRILPLFLVREMPTGLAGLLLAAILAVAMSNASGSLNSLAASSVMDFAALAGAYARSREIHEAVAADDAGVGRGADLFGTGALGAGAGGGTDHRIVYIRMFAGIVFVGHVRWAVEFQRVADWDDCGIGGGTAGRAVHKRGVYVVLDDWIVGDVRGRGDRQSGVSGTSGCCLRMRTGCSDPRKSRSLASLPSLNAFRAGGMTNFGDGRLQASVIAR